MNKIDSFTGEYDFLSNFYPCPIKYEGIMCTSTESAYQMAKTLDLGERKRVAGLNAQQSKKAGRKLKLRPDWESVKLRVMEDVLREKFKIQHLAEKLKATGTAELVEGNTWNDMYWGVCRGKGQNHLGRLLMKIRAELQNERT